MFSYFLTEDIIQNAVPYRPLLLLLDPQSMHFEPANKPKKKVTTGKVCVLRSAASLKAFKEKEKENMIGRSKREKEKERLLKKQLKEEELIHKKKKGHVRQQ